MFIRQRCQWTKRKEHSRNVPGTEVERGLKMVNRLGTVSMKKWL